MELPRELTTVTSFSRVFAAILFISLPILMFFIGVVYQQGANAFEENVKKRYYSIPQNISPSPLQNDINTLYNK